jgi:hypothetical protein
MLGRVLVGMAVLARVNSEQASSKVLAEAAREHNINLDVISAAVTEEFAERGKS